MTGCFDTEAVGDRELDARYKRRNGMQLSKRRSSAIAALAAMQLSAGCSSADDSRTSETTTPQPTSAATPSLASSTTASTTPAETAVTTTVPNAPAPTVSPAEPPTSLPRRIVCRTQYRPDAQTLTGAEEPTIGVDREDGVEIAEGVAYDFPTMRFRVSFHGDAPEGRNVSIAVTSTDEEPLLSVLFQLGDQAIEDIDFTSHGFTGLHYVSHNGALLQFSCVA